MIAEPPRERYALIPVALIGVALLLVALRGSPRERRGALLGLAVGVGVVLLASGAALAGKDYIVERNLLPALVPLATAAAVGFAASGARRIGLACAALLCAYWLAFDVYVTRTPNLQRPDFRDLARAARAAAPAARDRHLETRRRPDPLLSRRPLAARLPRRAPGSRDRRGQQAGRGEKASRGCRPASVRSNVVGWSASR